MWDKPAITAATLDVLINRKGPIGEYELIQHLSDAGYFAEFESDTYNLRLFKKHFITRHCLYSLQQDLDSHWSLRLNLMEIELQPMKPALAMALETDVVDLELRNFYLDLRQLEQADENSVRELLKRFWERFSAWKSGAEAYQVLELQPGAPWEDVQQAYRRAIQGAHPDLGGSAEEFTRLRSAYEILKKIVLKSN